MKRTLIIPLFTAVLVVAVAAPAYAHDGEASEVNDDRSGLLRNLISRAESTANKVDDTAKSTTDDASKILEDGVQSRKQRIEARKDDLLNELKQKRENRTEKLEGRRLAKCQNRQANINSLLDKSVGLGRERLAKIQGIEKAVKAFYENQALSSAEYDTLLQRVDEKEAAATAAIDVVDSEDFNCDQIDGAKPSDTIHTINEAKRTALHEYRASVQDLIRVVRQAFVEKQQQAGANDV